MPEFCTNPTISTPIPENADSHKGHHEEHPTLDLPDLRRRNARQHTEQISRRAQFLPRDQRALIAAVYEQGLSYRQLAAICGTPARCLRRDVQRILQRLASPEFVFVALHHDSWPATMQRVAQRCILAGEPVRSAAVTLRLSLHTVRKYRATVRLLADGAEPQLDSPSKGPRR